MNRQLELDEIEKVASQIGFASPNGIVIVDDTGAIVWTNEALELTFGYSAGELIGQPIECLVPDDKKDRHVKMRDGFIRKPSKRAMGGTLVLFGQHKEGRQIPVEVGLGSLESTDHVFTVAFVVDVTARYVREKELEIYRHNLEQVVSERTEELSLALRSTQANVKLLQDMLSSFSHEFRTPLSIMIGYAEIMKSMMDENIFRTSSTMMAYPDLMLNAGNKLVGLVDKVSKMTVVSAGKVAADAAPIDLNVAVSKAHERCCKLLRGTIPCCEVSLDEAPLVLGDEELLLQTLELLFENAAKYAGGDCTLRVSAEKRAKICRLLIDDDGAGLLETDYQKAFEPFERLQQKHGHISGAGLGLTLAQAYMHSMGGGIGMESSPQGGLRVWLELPLAEPQASEAL